MTSKRIFAITHTQATHHIEDLGGGWYDSALTGKGVTDAACIARNLRKELTAAPPVIYSSDLQRCRLVAEAIGQALERSVLFDPRLREMNYGDAGGKSRAWREQHISPLPVNGNRLQHREFEGAETKQEAASRMAAFVEDVLDHSAGDVVLVTHGFILTFLIFAWMKIPIASMDHGLFHPRAGRVTLLEEDEVSRHRSLIYYGSDHLLCESVTA